jgi:uncharacterized protein YbaA (DUF1428 family)
MDYVDGYVIPVPTDKRELYLQTAQATAIIFKEHGALSVVECWGDDVPEGKTTSFPLAVKCQPDETVVFSWITWRSRSARDEGMKKFMADPRLEPIEMHFDGRRVILGGFQMMLSC